MELQSVANYKWEEQNTEPVGTGLTVPNQALTPNEIMERYIRNQPIPELDGYGYTEANLSEFDHMDKFDKITRARQLKERIELLKKEATTKAEKEKAEQQEKEYNEKLEKAVNEKLATKNINTPEI